MQSNCSPIEERNKVYIKCDTAPATRESMRRAVASTDMRAVTKAANAVSYEVVGNSQEWELEGNPEEDENHYDLYESV